jgi:hypothetical protein
MSKFKYKIFSNILDKEDPKLKYVKKELPSPEKCIRMIVCAATGGGKSNFIKNMVFEKSYYAKYWDDVYIWSGNYDEVVNYQHLAKEYEMEDCVKVFDKYDDNALRDLYDQIEQAQLESPQTFNTLFVFDDNITDSDFMHRNKMNMIDTCFVRGRHARIHVIIATQKMMALNRNVRALNCNVVTIFHGVKEIDLEGISKEHTLSNKSPDETLQLIKNNVSNNYEFVTIDYTKDATECLRTGNQFKKVDF